MRDAQILFIFMKITCNKITDSLSMWNENDKYETQKFDKLLLKNTLPNFVDSKSAFLSSSSSSIEDSSDIYLEHSASKSTFPKYQVQNNF